MPPLITDELTRNGTLVVSSRWIGKPSALSTPATSVKKMSVCALHAIAHAEAI
jgi:hypothetical protein